jgi:hypothetical protein
MLRSAIDVSVSVSVATLSVGSVSVVPAGGVTRAVLASVPEADGETVASRVYVTVPPTGSTTVSLIDPPPLGVQDEPDEATHDQVAPSSALGKVSMTFAAFAAEGPVLVATIV